MTTVAITGCGPSAGRRHCLSFEQGRTTRTSWVLAGLTQRHDALNCTDGEMSAPIMVIM
jgi:hypothetical protein